MKQSPLLSLVLLLICYIGFGWYLSSIPPLRSPILVTTCHQIFGAPPPQPKDPIQREKESLDQLKPKPSYGTPSNLPSTFERKAAQSEANSKASPEISPSPLTAEPATGEGTNPANRETTLKESVPPEVLRAPSVQAPVAQTSRQKIVESFHDPCGFMIRHNVQAGFLAVSWIFISAFAFISPITSFSRFISRWFKSDTVAFLAIFCMAAFAAVMLYWLHVALQILTILAAEALARIEIQMSGLSGLQAFWILILVSLAGLTLGWFGNAII